MQREKDRVFLTLRLLRNVSTYFDNEAQSNADHVLKTRFEAPLHLADKSRIYALPMLYGEYPRLTGIGIFHA